MNDNERIDRRWKLLTKAFYKGDRIGALYQLRKMAKENVPAAFAELGNLYEMGGPGFEQDFEKAKYWYGRAIEDADDIEGYIGMARLYYFGKGVPIDYKKALEYYLIAEEINEPVAFFAIGRMYRLGQGVEKNISKAKEYYRRGVHFGSVQSLRALGEIELESGNKILGLYYRILAVVRAIPIFIRNRHDPRLRFC